MSVSCRCEQNHSVALLYCAMHLLAGLCLKTQVSHTVCSFTVGTLEQPGSYIMWQKSEANNVTFKACFFFPLCHRVKLFSFIQKRMDRGGHQWWWELNAWIELKVTTATRKTTLDCESNFFFATDDLQRENDRAAENLLLHMNLKGKSKHSEIPLKTLSALNLYLTEKLWVFWGWYSFSFFWIVTFCFWPEYNLVNKMCFLLATSLNLAFWSYNLYFMKCNIIT